MLNLGNLLQKFTIIDKNQIKITYSLGYNKNILEIGNVYQESVMFMNKIIDIRQV